MEALFAFIEICRKNKIELQLFISPRITHLCNASPYDSITELLMKRYEVGIIDFSNDSLFLNHVELIPIIFI